MTKFIPNKKRRMEQTVKLNTLSPDKYYEILCLLCKSEDELNRFIFENGLTDSDVTVQRRRSDFLLLNQLRSRCKTLKQLESYVSSKNLLPNCFAVKARQAELESLCQCQLCNKRFCSTIFKDKHERTCVERRTCKGCETLFASVTECVSHEKRCNKVTNKCENCQQTFNSASNYHSHKSTCIKRRRYKCSKCPFECYGRRLLSRHITSQHGGNQPLQDFTANLPNDRALQAEYDTNRKHILAQHRPERDKTVYNFPTSDLESNEEIAEHLQTIFDSEENAFRINASLGMILRDVTDGSYRYFIPYTNEQILSSNEVVSNRRDLNRVIRKLQNIDIRDYVNNQKPKSSLKPFYVTNVNYFVYPTNYPLGCRDITLPSHIKKSRSILSMDQYRGNKFNDNLCIFRCLYHARNRKLVKVGVESLFKEWCEYLGMKKQPTLVEFQGVQFNELPKFEDCFKVALNIYEQHEETMAVTTVYISKTSYKEKINLNMFETHLSLITNMKLYAQKFICSKCARHFTRLWNLQRHLKSCANNTRFCYPGGYVKRPTNVFEEIRFYGIEVEETGYDKFATFDFEAILEKCTDNRTDKQTINAVHRAVSVSVCSNVDGFKEAINFISSDLECLLGKMISHIASIQEAAAREMNAKFSNVFEKIDSMIDKYKPKTDNQPVGRGTQQNTCVDSTGFDNDSDDDVTDGEEQRDSDIEFIDDESETETDYVHDNPYMERDFKSLHDKPNEDERIGSVHVVKNLRKLREKVEIFCEQLPVIGFNSSRYDLNLIKGKLAKCLNIADDRRAFVIKKCSKYMCIATSKFRFLDISSYLAPNVSYAQFLKCYDIEEQKQFFPYEFLDCFEKLEYSELPPVEAFYSTLKGKNSLEANGKSLEQNYDDLRVLWQERGMKTLADLLAYYNNFDVIGLTRGIEKMQLKFLEENVSIFKETISISNYARRKLFRSTDAVFPLFDSNTRDIFKTVQANIVGGPSIIFTRYMEAGKSFIKNQPFDPVQKIIGLDANALYPYALSQEMPTGPYVDRREENNFRPEISTGHVYQYAWMDRVAYDEGVEIKHKLNNGGKECRVGPYYVDGMSFTECDNDIDITVYEYWGCFHHFHEACQRLSTNEKTARRQQKAREHTEAKRQFILGEGFKLVEIWECDFIKNEKKRCFNFLDKYVPSFWRNYGAEEISLSLIEIGVKNGDIFGLVECDIGIEAGTKIRGINAEDYYRDFPPIFCTTDVPMTAVGGSMTEYMLENNLSQLPRRQLVSGTKASRILLATPLLKWYLKNGFSLTRVYRVIEFKSRACFKQLIESGTNERRAGDVDKSKAILADTAKITLNSYYGSVIMDKTKHRRVRYVRGVHALRLLVNDPAFVCSTHVGDDIFEVELIKRRVNLDTCNYIAHFVLNYAKLHMVKFVYEVLHRYLRPQSWQYLEMDTDSLYSAFNGRTLFECVKPELRDEFYDKIHNSCHLRHVDPSLGYWFPRECCDAHKKYDKRSPGLMKTEQTGDMMICLSSKTYLLTEKEQYKLTCKGVRKDSITSPIEIFRSVLANKQAVLTDNVGFRALQNTMVTYTQRKTGFSWLYTKREVLPNGIDTIPLKITLTPWKDNNSYVIREDCMLSNWCACELTHDGLVFMSAQHLYMYMLAVHLNDAQLSIDILNCSNKFSLCQLKVECSAHEAKHDLMRDVLDIKFSQSALFRQLLVRSGTRNILMSGKDKYWELGLAYRYAIVTDPQEYVGANFLGALLQDEYRSRLL